MPELLLVLFKINLVLLLFAAAYYLILRRLTFYTLNRAFLVLGIIFSTIYPFINLTDFFRRQQQINPKVTALVPTVDVNALIRDNAIIDYWQILVVLFYVGVAFMATRLIAQFVSLYRVHKSSSPGSVRNLPVRILDGKLSPFSFWQTVYVNPSIHSENELDTILAHEQVHVKEWHTLDIILAEVSVVFYWFNPGVWLMKRAIKENIEFITDARIVKKGIDKKAYQYSLLGVGNLHAGVALVNNFNLSDLKKRIKMMNAKRSSPKKLMIYAVILPVLLVTTLAFTVSKKEVKKHLIPLSTVFNEVGLFNEPTLKEETSKPKFVLKPRVAPIHKQIAKVDSSIHASSIVVNSITFTTDSLNVVTNTPATVSIVKSENTLGAPKGMIKIASVSPDKAFFYQSKYDSLSSSDQNRYGKGMKIEFKAPSKSSTTAESKVILVENHTKNPLFKADSTAIIDYRDTYINGKIIGADMLKSIKPEDVKSITIQRSGGVVSIQRADISIGGKNI